jgi:hypothetical protein
MLTAAEFAEAEMRIGELEAAGVQLDDDGMTALTTPAMVIGFVFRSTLQDDADEEHALDMCETLVRLVSMTPTEVRDLAAILGRIGFLPLAARLRQVAGRRLRELVPLQ